MADRQVDQVDRAIMRERASDLDWWGRLPGVVKVFIAIVAIWMAGWTSALVAERFSGIPSIVDSHDRRITALEQQGVFEADRTNRHLQFLACRIEDLIAGTEGRCDLVLDATSRAVLEGLRRPRIPPSLRR